MALYRKYRPATFAEVVGQEHVTEPLSTALTAGRINHAYLFSGPRGCGKTSSARILARSLNCAAGPTPTPCGVCDSCAALAPNGGGSIDVVELDAASHGGVDDTRELRDRAFYAPAQSRYRIFIVDEAHMVTTAGFNALLKIVEEPPEHLIFVFATTEPEKVLPTIRSRTHHYPFRLLAPRTMRGLLDRICAEEHVSVDDAVYPLVIRAGGGSPRDTLSVLDQLLAGSEVDASGGLRITYQRALGLLGATDAALIDGAVDALAAGDAATLFGSVEAVIDAGHDPRRFATDLLERFRDLIVLQAVPDAVAKGVVDAPEDALDRMREQATHIGMGTLTRYAEVVQAGLGEMRGATAPRLLLEVICARLLLPSAADTEAALLQRVERIETRLEMSLPAGEGTPGPARQYSRPSRSAEAPQPPEPAAQPRGEAPQEKSEAPQPAVPRQEAPRTETPRAEAPQPAVPQPEAPRPEAPRPEAPRQEAPQPPAAAPESAPAPRQPATESAPAPRPQAREPVAAPRPPESAPTPRPQTPEPVAPQEPAKAAAPGQPDVGAVRSMWSTVREKVRERSRTTEVMLAGATVRAVADNTLLLAHESEPLANRLSEQRNADVIADALKDALGVNWRVRCEFGAPEPAAPSTETATRVARETERAAAREAAQRAEEDSMLAEASRDDTETPRVDPEEAALQLLQSELGARPIDNG